MDPRGKDDFMHPPTHEMSALCSLLKKFLFVIGFFVWLLLFDSVIRLTSGTKPLFYNVIELTIDSDYVIEYFSNRKEAEPQPGQQQPPELELEQLPPPPPPEQIQPKNLYKRKPYTPKRDSGPYVLYMDVKHEDFQLLHPDMKYAQRAKLIAKTYLELEPEELREWEERAAADRSRHTDEMARYVPLPVYDPTGTVYVPSSGHYPTIPPKSKSHLDPKVPRRNASPYLLYHRAKDQEFRLLHPELTNGRRSKLISKTYSELGPEVKEEWQERFAADQARFMEELTWYVPSPGYDNEGNLIDPDLSPEETQEWEERVEAKVARFLDRLALTYDKTGHLVVPWTPASEEEARKPHLVETVLEHDKSDAETSIE